jgi:hypothetical protein
MADLTNKRKAPLGLTVRTVGKMQARKEFCMAIEI